MFKSCFTLGSIVIFIIVTLPIQGHGMSLHLFVLSLISFISVYIFSEYKYFASLGRLIPRCFTLLDLSVNGIIFLIYLSDLL